MRERDLYDVSSSEVEPLGSDEDELSHIMNPSTRGNRRTPAPARRVTKLQSAIKGKSKAVITAEAEVVKTKAKARAARTYGSRANPSDKENIDAEDLSHDEDDEADPDDSLAPVSDDVEENADEGISVLGKELQEAKKKFQDVDKWQMEFEDFTGGSSSERLKDAR